MVDNIEVNTQNSIRIVSRVGIIYVDPLAINDEVHDADFILITHDHYDHFSPEDIRIIPCIRKRKRHLKTWYPKYVTSMINSLEMLYLSRRWWIKPERYPMPLQRLRQ